ncbi:hypothetical protein DL769_005417 [Monosporascus sp. CRB-8-3]|nr:hypothetical protein DL769_005417 [Monosporascus sp. CRB-8-3]
MPAEPSTGEPSQASGGRSGPPRSRPLWKKKPHRRSPHACDECRLRKRACDATEPCGPCRNASLSCTYHFRRPVPPPTLRIRNLQHHLRLARSWLQEVQKNVPEVPGLDIDNCLRILDFTLPEDQSTSPQPPATSPNQGSKQATLSNMLAGCDRFTAVGPGATCFYGAYSELSFILRTLEVFEQDAAVSPDQRFLVVSNLFNHPLPSQEDANPSPKAFLPSADVVMALLDAVFARNHPMLSFLPERHVKDVANVLAGPQGLPISDQSLSLFHLTLALGYLFDSSGHREEGCRDILQRATRHFHIGLIMLRPTQVNDLTTLQAVLCAVIFLISTSRMTSAHSLIGTACSSALRLGLHSAEVYPYASSAEDRQARTRLFATVLRLDMFASLVLDLPPFLHKDALPLPHIARLASEAEAEGDLRTAAALRLVCLLVIPLSKRIYCSVASSGHEDSNSVDIKHFEDAQNEFRRWKTDASSLLASLGHSKAHRLIKDDLEMTYNFGHIILCRPFLHYLRVMADGGSISVMQSYHALACIKLASSTIVRAHEMLNEGLLLAGFWPSIYTIFLSVMCLIFLIAAHHGTSRPSKAWQRAAVGIRIITAFKCVDDCSTPCLEVLKMVMNELSHTVYFDFIEMETSVIRNCDKNTSSGRTSQVQSPITPSNPGYHEARIRTHGHRLPNTQTKARPNFGLNIPESTHVEMASEADRMLVQAEKMSTEFDFPDMVHLSDTEYDVKSK